MEILIVTTSFESLKTFISKLTIVENLGKNYARFQYNDQMFDVLISGFGTSATCYHLAKAFQLRKYDMVIQLGECYSLKDKIENDQIVCLIDDYFGDLGIGTREEFVSVFDLNLIHKDASPFQNEILENEVPFLDLLVDYRKVSAISCNAIPTSIHGIANSYRKNQPDVISRVGAGTLYACLEEDIKLIQLFYVIDRIENAAINYKMPEEKSDLFSKSLETLLDEIFAKLVSEI
jgi:hypothetical protein